MSEGSAGVGFRHDASAAERVISHRLAGSRTLVRLVLARLAVSIVSFGIAIGLNVLQQAPSQTGLRGLFGTLSFAFVATLVASIYLGLKRVRSPERFATLQIAVDVGLITSLVHFSGGYQSVFSFLYVLTTVYGAVLFERRVAFGAATLSAVSYGVILFLPAVGWIYQPGASGPPPPVHLLIADWSVHVGALFLVGVLASVLTGELRRAGDALDRRTSDLRRLRDLHERTVESLMSGLLTCDSRGFITTFNPEAERIVGRAAEDVIGREVDAVVLGAASLLASVGEDPADPTARTRLQFRRHDGEVLSLGLSASILMDEDGDAMGHVLIFQDVTPVVAMEMDLWRSERMAAVGEMAAKIAHEIRNPLAAISGSIQVMQGGVGEPEEQPQLMEIVVRETDRLNVLITDFLRYARPGPLKRERVPLANLIDELLKLLESVRPDGVEIRAECGEPVAVYADPGQLRQVLWNLCINALQAMPDGGFLRVQSGSVIGKKPQGGPEGRRNGAEGVTSAETCEWGEIVVADNGVGIPEETLEQIFEPFFTTKPEGSGLGLSTVHRIVESHGGVLQLSSQKGEGTVVRVRLPLAREAEVGESAKDAEGST